MQLNLQATTRSLPGCAIRLKNPLTTDERRIIEARIDALQAQLSENERRRDYWVKTEILLIGTKALERKRERVRRAKREWDKRRKAA